MEKWRGLEVKPHDLEKNGCHIRVQHTEIYLHIAFGAIRYLTLKTNTNTSLTLRTS